MSNDNGLIDEYEKIQAQKKDLDIKEEELKKKLISLSQEKNTDILFGSNKKCLIKEYEKVIYPEDKTQIIELIKKKGAYDRFSSISYPKLSSAILHGIIDPDITNLIKKEKAFRLSFKEIS